MRIGALLLLAGAAFAQPSPEPPQEKGGLSGRVVNTQTGAPLAKARVTLFRVGGRGEQATQTDVEGRYAFQDLEPGRYFLAAQRPGYVSRERGARQSGGPASPVAVQPGRTVKDIEIKLLPQGVISGRVVDEDGEPLESAQVIALQYRWDYSAKRRQLVPAGFASTNDLGEYRIWGLRPGPYYLKALKQDRAGWRGLDTGWNGEPDTGYAPVFYPGVLEGTQAAAVGVAAGVELQGPVFRLSKTRTYRVRGRVLLDSGSPNSRAMVSLMPRQAGAVSWFETQRAATDPKGNFEFKGLQPGSYSIVTRVPGGAGELLQARQLAEITDRSVTGVSLTLAPGLEISGTARVEEAESWDFRDSAISLRSESGERLPGAFAKVEPNGTFRLRSLVPERYRLSARAGSGSYLKRITYGQDEIRDSLLDLTQAAPGARLDLLFSKAVAEVSGVVRDEDNQPVAGAMVVLLPESGLRDDPERYAFAATDQYGTYTVSNIRPGQYKAIALENAASGEFYDTGFMKPFEEKATPLELPENGRKSLDLKAVTTGAHREDGQ